MDGGVDDEGMSKLINSWMNRWSGWMKEGVDGWMMGRWMEGRMEGEMDEERSG